MPEQVTPETVEKAAERLMALGRDGFTVTICCGPMGGSFGGEVGWSVDVMSPTGEEFDRPYAAASLQHAVEIAEIEVRARWRR